MNKTIAARLSERLPKHGRDRFDSGQLRYRPNNDDPADFFLLLVHIPAGFFLCCCSTPRLAGEREWQGSAQGNASGRAVHFPATRAGHLESWHRLWSVTWRTYITNVRPCCRLRNLLSPLCRACPGNLGPQAGGRVMQNIGVDHRLLVLFRFGNTTMSDDLPCTLRLRHTPSSRMYTAPACSTSFLLPARALMMKGCRVGEILCDTDCQSLQFLQSLLEKSSPQNPKF